MIAIFLEINNIYKNTRHVNCIGGVCQYFESDKQDKGLFHNF